MTSVRRVIHRPSQTWFWLAERKSFGRSQFSADGQDTWHNSTVEAFRQATAAGKLEICENQNPKERA